MKKTIVVYIAGTGRSGSTLLDRVLGSASGVTSLNEVYRLLIDLYEEPGNCSCGVSPKDCDFWSQVLSKIEVSESSAKRILRCQRKFSNTRHFNAILNHKFDEDPEFQVYCEWLARLYAVLAEVSGTNVIIDSSKVPTMALILSRLPNIDLRMVHIVRDPAQVCNAWTTRKFDPSKNAQMHRQPIWKTALRWRFRNKYCARLAREVQSARVRYEDLMVNPSSITAALISAVASDIHPGVNFDDRTIELHPVHSLSGNPDRHEVGAIEIRMSLSKRVSLIIRVVAGMLTFPLIYQYGYKIFGAVDEAQR